MAKIEYEQDLILMAKEKLNEITVSGLQNAENLIIVSKLLDSGKIVPDRDKCTEEKGNPEKKAKEETGNGKR